MARSRHYSPQLSRFLVSALYHEGKRRRIPMTKLVDELLRNALQDSPGWTQATNLKLAEDPIPVPAQAA